MRQINAETEAWCRQAAERGEGCRLWRSDPIVENDLRGMRYRFEFQILELGMPAPRSGMLFGPWSKEFLDGAIEALGELVGEPLGELADLSFRAGAKIGR
ncbi:hypothetical protein [Sphingopyxis macrogoltabida]|uniref:hypothetical protein n=1 Tax=Sphingopyxis macrogoltabida TaxID=33050 RepID=UPI0006CA856B|nr:hypothetical protein [Sphingopyxis macrogoltabida]